MTRANEDAVHLARLLDEMRPGRSIADSLDAYPEQRKRLEGVLRLAARLSEAPAIEPSTAFRSQSPRRLQARLSGVRRAGGSAARPRSGSAFRLSWALASLLVLALLGTTGLAAAYAADGSSPGSVLYPLDRAVEGLRLGLATSPEHRASLALAFAEERLLELGDLSTSDGTPERLDLALTGYVEAIDVAAAQLASVAADGDAARTQALDDLIQAATAVHPQVLASIKDSLPEAAHAAIDRAITASQSGVQALGPILSGDTPGDSPQTPPGGPPIDLPVAPSGSEPSAEDLDPGAELASFEDRLSALDDRIAEIQGYFASGRTEEGRQAVLEYEDGVTELAAEVSALASQDRERAEALAARLEQTLSAHGLMLTGLLPSVAAEGRAFVEQALHASEAGRQRAAQVLGTIIPGGPPGGLPVGPP